MEPTEIDLIRDYEWYYGGDPFPRIEATLHETMHQRMYDVGTLRFEGGAMGEIAGGETDTIPWTSLVIQLDQVTSRFASG